MPEHISFFDYLLMQFPSLQHHVQALGHTLFGKPLSRHSLEPITGSVFVCLVLILLAWKARQQLNRAQGQGIIPDGTLSLRTFFEILVSIFYNMMKSMMGYKRAKRCFPLIGTASCFIFFSNFIGLIPGFSSPTSSWSITFGCALVVFILFHYYGIREHGMAYFKHFAGPIPALAPLIFPLEVISTCLRPLTLSLRLMLNMAVGHLLLTITTGIVMVAVPIPLLMLETLNATVQVVVFCLLSSIYISLATEHHQDH
ncbi:F0F1 ATP synthase subunit A [Pajaroellobacter abortibovis]|uniref:ATP synthase subunit a n=1 Tax=Pajaroellobacter abortibovis TaxID=1882918 RepID=A0A1L6MYS4_9BACT|nr:F0F1 ATP synthase subunit A [Pajaroellobacter abortibovis]APS00568.1 ATP synthase F0 subunit A [Pajaroellobacter abortibovis]